MRTCPQCSAACEPEHQYCPGCGFPVGAVTASNEDALIGQTLPGGYLILDLLSVGGMGRVYRAEQRALGRTVAVKVIHPHLLSDDNSIARFMTEARAASRLNHPNSVSVIDFGKTADGKPYLVMEFLRGKDLARVLYEESPLPIKRVVDVLRQVLQALGEAHDIGIVHRDLKPENIILEPLRRGGDFVKVVDFGLAKLKADAPGASTSITMPGIVCGTPDYMAPEQGRGDDIDGRSDLYAVGVILFQMLTGRVPFEADSPTRVVMMHITTPAPDPRQAAPERSIPDSLAEVTLKALAKKPGDRYTDAQDFAEALEEALREAKRGPSQRPERTSIRPETSVECPQCEAVVPLARFCCECSARLPSPSAEPGPGSHPTLPLQFTGRAEELSWLEEQRQAARSGRCRAARLVGESGIGKTRLLNEFLEHAEREGDTVVRCTPDPYWAQVGYHGLRGAVTRLARLGSGERERHSWTGASSHTRAALEEILGGVPGGGAQLSATERRAAAVDALRWSLARAHTLAPSGAIVIALDDLHRFDGASQLAFQDIVAEPPDGALLLIATHPPNHDSGWGEAHSARTLTGLPLPDVMRLLKSVGPSERIAAMSESAIQGLSPLYVEQVLRFSMEGGSDPPLRVADLISHRMDTLTPEARRALQAVGVLGDGASLDEVGKLIDRNEQLDGCIEQLERAGMLIRAGTGLSVAHPLLREILLGIMPAGVRRELHARAARIYDVREAPIEVRALHAYYAEDSLEALMLLEQVAGRAIGRGDVRAAVDSLRRALELARQDVYKGELDDPLRAVVIFGRKLGDALMLVGDYADADGVLREALDMAGPTDNDRAHLLASLGRVARARQRNDEALEYLGKAIDLGRRLGLYDLVSELRATRREWAG